MVANTKQFNTRTDDILTNSNKFPGNNLSDVLDSLENIGNGAVPYNVLIIDPTLTEDVPGRAYRHLSSSDAGAVTAETYMASQQGTDPVYFEVELPSGEFSEDITLQTYYTIKGNNTILSGSILSGIQDRSVRIVGCTLSSSVASSVTSTSGGTFSFRHCVIENVQGRTSVGLAEVILSDCTVKSGFNLKGPYSLYLLNSTVEGNAEISQVTFRPYVALAARNCEFKSLLLENKKDYTSTTAYITELDLFEHCVFTGRVTMASSDAVYYNCEWHDMSRAEFPDPSTSQDPVNITLYGCTVTPKFLKVGTLVNITSYQSCMTTTVPEARAVYPMDGSIVLFGGSLLRLNCNELTSMAGSGTITVADAISNFRMDGSDAAPSRLGNITVNWFDALKIRFCDDPSAVSPVLSTNDNGQSYVGYVVDDNRDLTDPSSYKWVYRPAGLDSLTNVIMVDPNFAVDVTGKAYKTFASAKTYIESAASGTKFAVHLPAGTFSEAIVLMPDVEIVGANTVLTGNLSSTVTSEPDIPSLLGCTVNSNIIPDNGKIFSISHCHWAPSSYYPSGVAVSTSVIRVSASSIGNGTHTLGPVSVIMDHCNVAGTFAGTSIEFSECDLDSVTMGVTSVAVNDSSVTSSSFSSTSLTSHASRFSNITGLTPNGAYAFYSCEFTDLPSITGNSASILFDHCKVNVVPSGSATTTRTFTSCPMTFKNESILDTSGLTAITFSGNTTPLSLDCTSTAYDVSGDFESKITYASNTPSVSIEKKIAVRYSTYPNGYDLNNNPAMTTTDQSQSYAGLFSTNRGADPDIPSNYVWFNRGAGINGAVMYHKIYVDTTKITNVQEGMFSTYKEAWDHLIAFREAEWATAHGAQQGTAWDPTYDYEPWRIELQSGTLKNPTGSNVNDVLMERNVEIHGNNTLLDVPIVPATIWFAKGVDVSALVDSQTGLPTPFAQIMTAMKNIGAYMYTTYATSLQRSKITGCTVTMIDIDRRYDIEGVNGLLGDDFDFTTSTATYMTGTINAFTFASCIMDCSVILKPNGFKYDKMYDTVNTMSLKIISNPAVASQLFSNTTAGQLVEGLLFYANNYVFFTEHAAIHTDLDFTCNTILGLYNDFIVCPQAYAEDLVTGASGWYKPFKISGLMVKSCNTRFLSVPYTTNDIKLAVYAAHQPLFYQAFNINVASYSSSFSNGTFYDSDYIVNSMRIATLAGATFYDCVFESFGSIIMGFDTIQMFKPFNREYIDPGSGNTFRLFANLFEVDRFNWALRQTNYNLQSESGTFYDNGDPSNGVYPLRYFPETGNIFIRFSDFTLSTLAGSTSTTTYGLVYGILSFADQLLKTILNTVNEVSFQNCTLDLYRAGFRLARIGDEYTTYISNMRSSVAAGNALKSYKIPFKEKIANETWNNSTDVNDRVLISLADCSNSNRYKAAYSTSASSQTYLATSARYFQADKAMLVVSGDELKVYNNTISPGAPTGTTTGTLPAAISSGISKENRTTVPSF